MPVPLLDRQTRRNLHPVPLGFEITVHGRRRHSYFPEYHLSQTDFPAEKK
jgi:hypothetical protein